MLSQQSCLKKTENLMLWCEQNGVDLVIVSDPKDIYYLTGFLRKQYGWLISRIELFASFRNGESLLFCCESIKNSAQEVAADRVITYKDYDINDTTEIYIEQALEPWKDTLSAFNKSIKTIGIEKRYTSISVLETLRELYPEALFVDISDIILGMRKCKSLDEVKLIKKAADLSCYCYRFAAGEIRAGKTEVDIYAACNGAYAKKVGGYVTFSGDFISGERGLNFGGPPTDRVLKDNETFILDLWVELNGYWADSARSYFIGENQNKKQNELYDLVIKAQESGEKMLRPGIKSNQVYKAVYKVFDDAQMSQYFPLHAGHGIGLSSHEKPLFIPASEDILKEGMVCTLEPGLYVPEIGSVRCEDIYVIREGGPERLTEIERKI